MKTEHGALMDKINATGDWNDEIAQGLQTAIESFVKTHSW
jgi:F-type H+-transporting ATPase subunit alpha